MNRLVSYSETSSDDEDKHSIQNNELEFVEKQQGNVNKNAAGNTCTPTLAICRQQKPLEVKVNTDLPITDESDDERREGTTFSTRLPYLPFITHSSKSIVTKSNINLIANLNDSEVIDEKNTDLRTQNRPHSKIEESDLFVKQSCTLNKDPLPSVTGNGVHEIGLRQSDTSFHDDQNMNECLRGKAVMRSAPTPDSDTLCLSTSRKRKLNSDSKEHLPLPNLIKSMYQDRQKQWVDNPAEHENRIRSFPHMEGNWATHVFIPVKRSEPLTIFVDQLLSLLTPPTFETFEDFHVSLSRTVTIRYHWIEPLIDSLRENLKPLNSCISDLAAIRLFTNDEKTRTFVCIELSHEEVEFMDYVKAVNKSFAEFKLPAYYENPSFHISVGWCLGDVVDKISDEKLSKAKEMLGDFVAANPNLGFLYVQQICCQSGNKSFVIQLQD